MLQVAQLVVLLEAGLLALDIPSQEDSFLVLMGLASIVGLAQGALSNQVVG